ncbi:THUMP-like domain-containing protein [Muriicola sp. Z0-33]|uniref:class I SAM-dependent methyltransferase n=1 Tax=Muriicola sp. Z0-33 TaxID=2816957 RepID=UPI002AA2AA7E|nr:class I SAM-dependent methyltransferase [Muriicola sp. Z0-33]
MSVLLKKSPFEGIEPKELAQQIASRKKCQFKLPLWFNTPGVYYPKKTNIEQCSSEITAAYKAEIVSGKSLLDLSGGFGVDSTFFSKNIKEVWHTEIDRELSEIAAYNFDKLGVKNIKSYHADGITFLESNEQEFDWIYIDPSRRDTSQNKVFRLSDCHPDVPAHLPLILSKTNNILLKTSPLLDISSGLSALQHVMEIHIVAVNNEVKELLWVLQNGYSGAITIKTINFQKNDRHIFNFELGLEKSAALHLSAPLAFLYEPNAAIMKSGAFKLIGNQFSLKKLHEHTHLYTSDHLINFPGRRFNILKAFRYNRKEITSLKLDKANVSVRNFPVIVAEIRKKFKIKDGGNTYLFFITDLDNNLKVLLCNKC